VDLGSGAGVAVAVSAVDGRTGKTTGAEWFLKRHQAACALAHHLQRAGQLRCPIQLLRCDFLEPNIILTQALQEAHVVLVNNCTFSEELNVKMCQGPLRLMPAGSVLVTLASVTPAWAQARPKTAVERLGMREKMFLDPSMSKANSLAPQLVQCCSVIKVKGGLGWTNTDANLFVYRRVGP
jgi:hypothetical protein